jgi:hypothetical protein
MSSPLTITVLTAAEFASPVQVGSLETVDTGGFLEWLTTPTIADDKRAAGAWCPSALPGGIVKGGAGPVSLLAFDVDTCGAGGIDRTARALATYAGAVVPSYGASTGNPEKVEAHRVALMPSRALDPDEFKIAWPFLDRALARAGIAIDKSCKNINRLYFATAARSLETWLGARILRGAPVDVDALLVAARREAAEIELARAARPTAPTHSHGAYLQGVLRSAADNVAKATAGERHGALIYEAYSLARFSELHDSEIHAALLGPFVAAAGEARRREGERSIADAIRARREATR